MKCALCHREAETQHHSKYCEKHQKADDNLQNGFENWKKSSNIEWRNYLEEVAKNPFTGTWVREVVDSLLSELGKTSKRNV